MTWCSLYFQHTSIYEYLNINFIFGLLSSKRNGIRFTRLVIFSFWLFYASDLTRLTPVAINLLTIGTQVLHTYIHTFVYICGSSMCKVFVSVHIMSCERINAKSNKIFDTWNEFGISVNLWLFIVQKCKVSGDKCKIEKYKCSGNNLVNSI